MLSNLYEQAAALVDVGLFMDDALRDDLDIIKYSYLKLVASRALNKTVVDGNFADYRLGPLIKLLISVGYLIGPESDYKPTDYYIAALSWLSVPTLTIELVSSVLRETASTLLTAHYRNEIYCLGYDAS